MSSNQTVQANQHSGSWIAFTYASFFGALGMLALGILFAPVEYWVKAYFGMAAVFLVQSSITMTKTLRDVHENARFVNRLDDAKAERLLMEIERGKN
jgi:hypothetical protein